MISKVSVVGSSTPEIVSIIHSDRAFRFRIPSPHDHIGKILKETEQFYEIEMLDDLTFLLKSGDLVVDAGANIGNHSVFFSTIADARVVSFEPIKSIVDYLCENLELNGIDDNVEVRPYALGNEPGFARIDSMDPENLGGTSLAVGPRGDIKVSTLDHENFDQRISLIKIDVEGMDLEVVVGGKNLISQDRPVIVVEAITSDSQRLLQAYMEDISYALVGQYNSSPTFVYLPSLTQSENMAIVRYLGRLASKRLVESRVDRDGIRRVGRYVERLHRESLGKIKDMSEIIQRNNNKLGEQPTTADDNDWHLETHLLIQENLHLRARLKVALENNERLDNSLVISRDMLLSSTRELEQQTIEFEAINGRLLDTWKSERQALESERAVILSNSEAAKTVIDKRTDQISRLTKELEKSRRETDAALAVQRELVISRGGYARKAKDYRHQIEELRVRSKRTSSELSVLSRDYGQLHSSASFVIGNHIMIKSKTPWGIVSLLWSLPSLVVSQYRKSRLSR